MAQQVKVMASMPANMGLIWETHMVEGKNWFEEYLISTSTNKYTDNINAIKII